MKRIFIYVKPNVNFEKFVGTVGVILGIPLLEYETDRYDEYPAYEAEDENINVKILGIPPDLDNLRKIFPDYYGQKDESYQISFLLFKDPPLRAEMGVIITEESYEIFGEKFIAKLKDNDIFLADNLAPEFSEI